MGRNILVSAVSRPYNASDDEIRRAPAGKFRVISYDMYDYEDYRVGDFDSIARAVRAARERAAVPNAIPVSYSNKYFVYDYRCICRYRIEYDDRQE